MSDEYAEPILGVDVSAQDIDEIVSQFRLFSRRLSHQQMERLFSELPKLTEVDLLRSGHRDDVCPICFNTFLATLAEEELAHAMDSPAHPLHELGVTRLQKTCGHIFCRKDIMKWITEGHDSCPSCRQSLFTDEERRENAAFSQQRENWLRPWLVDSNTVARDMGLPAQLPTLSIDSIGVAEDANTQHRFSGMYS